MAEQRITTGGRGDLRPLIDGLNAQAVKLDALLAKLDLDAGVTDNDYAATSGPSETYTG